MKLSRDGRGIVFIWVPGQVGIRKNWSADSAAKDALVGDISVELIPYSDPKPRANKYSFELWQSENSSRKINYIYSSKFETVYYLFSDKQKIGNCDSPITHWPFIYHSFLFIKG